MITVTVRNNNDNDNDDINSKTELADKLDAQT